MRALNPDFMVRLALVPDIARHLKSRYPEASLSLWQRDAKVLYKRLIGAPSAPSIERAGSRLRAVYDIACLLVAFHASAPQDVEVSEDVFDETVDLALRSPVTYMLFKGARPFEDETMARVSSMLSSPDVSSGWSGALEALGEDADETASGFTCSVTACPLLEMCVGEKRYFLLKHLCVLEGALTHTNGGRLEYLHRLSIGDPSCELTCEKA